MAGVGQRISDRDRAEAEIADRLRFETLLAEVSSRFVQVPAGQIDDEINHGLRRVCESLGLELGTVWRSLAEPESITLTHFYASAGTVPPALHLNGLDLFPWCFGKVTAGEVVAVASVEKLPPEAAQDRENWRRFGIKSNLTFGLGVGGKAIAGALSFNTLQAEHSWPEPLVKRLELLAQMFSGVLARQRIDMALRESEEDFRSLVENATIGVYRTTPDGRILMANPTLLKMLGCPDFESLARRNLEEEGFEPAYSRTDFREQIEKEGQVIGLEAAWRKSDGSVIFVRESARAIRGADGAVLWYDGSVEDVTARKRAEHSLRQRASFDEMMTRVLNLFVSCRPSEVDVAAVKALEEIAGLIGVDHAYIIRASRDLSSWSMTHEWCGPGTRAQMPEFQEIPMGTMPRNEQLILGGEIIRINSPDEYPLDALGERRMQEVEGNLSELTVPLRTPEGILSCIGLHSHARAVTWSDEDVAHLRTVGDALVTALERKKAQDKLQTSEKKFSAAFRASPASMVILSLATGRYIDVNKAFEQSTGLRAEEVVGHTPQEVGPHLTVVRPAEAGQATVEHGSFRNVEIRYRAKSGELRTGFLSAESIELDGELCSLRVMEDITERRRVEEASREIGKRMVMAQEEERRRLARELHDDFSQRLALLAIDLEQLLKKPPASTEEWIAQVRAMSSQTQELTIDIHHVSHQLHPSKLEDVGLVAALRGYCREFSKQAGLDVQFSSADVPRALPKEISLCIYRIAQEALRNVAKHSGAKSATVDLSAASSEICLTVSDAGRGVSPEASRENRGLGLVSMQERVRYVGGVWSLDSRPNEGTRVMVRIPLPSRQAVAGTPQSPRETG